MSLSSNIRAGRAYVEVTAETSKLQRNLTSAQAQLQNFGRTCTNVGKDLLMLSGAMAAPLVMAARSFAGFDDSILHRAIMKAEEEFSNEALADEAAAEVLELNAELSAPLTESQRQLLDELSEWAENAKDRQDSKSKAILHWLNIHLKTDGKWNNKRVILFTWRAFFDGNTRRKTDL